MKVDLIEKALKKIDEGEYYRDPSAFVEARRLLNDLIALLKEEHESIQTTGPVGS